MKKVLIFLYMLICCCGISGVVKAAWDTYKESINVNINIGNISTVSYNISKSTSISNDLKELGITYTNTYKPQIIGAYLFKNNTQYDLILYFNNLYFVDSDVFNITINNTTYDLDYTSNINSCYLSSKSYYTCQLDSYYRKKIYIKNVGNIDFLKINWVDYYYETTDDDDNYYTCDDIVDINKTINVIKGF